MTPDELKSMFGPEYPTAVVVDGIRCPLEREGRFSRSYNSKEHKIGSVVSRFMDGSASIDASELQREWHTWPRGQRIEFSQSCVWLQGRSDFPDMLRFLMHHAGPEEWSGLAASVASELLCDEAFDLLLRALRTMEIGRTCNIVQAIALTKHPDAAATLRRHLEAIWAHPAIWDDDKFVNWVAYDAITCLAHLLELGAAPSEFESQVRQLAAHVCSGNRDSCRNFLSKYYEWLT